MEFFDRLTTGGVLKHTGRFVARGVLVEPQLMHDHDHLCSISKCRDEFAEVQFDLLRTYTCQPHTLQGLVMSDELHKAVAFEDCDSYELFSPADR
jgi:hypothetical protein